jgi:uncharacterized protein (DUF1330 family)
MSVYIIAQLKFTRREFYDRYQSRFMGVFKKFRGKLLVADAHPVVLEGEWPRDKVVIMNSRMTPPRRNSRIRPNIRRYRWIEKRAPTPLC